MRAPPTDCSCILIGDVWLLGGQRNMEFPIHKVDAGAIEIASAMSKAAKK